MQTARLDPSPFWLDGGSVGCLLLHGLTGSPPEMRPLAEFLNQRGVTICCPLLPGHGTTPADLAGTRWSQWAASAEAALAELRLGCAEVFVAGLSMGAVLALHLAARHPELCGMALFSPALKLSQKGLFLLPLAKHVLRYWPKRPRAETDLVDLDAPDRIWSYSVWPLGAVAQLSWLQRVVRAALPGVRVPAIVFHATRDSVIHSLASQMTCDRLGASDKELVILHNSGHCMTVDSEWEAISARTFGFMVARAHGLA